MVGAFASLDIQLYIDILPSIKAREITMVDKFKNTLLLVMTKLFAMTLEENRVASQNKNSVSETIMTHPVI